jgi:Spy/CpxP family protein refolding chaperone
MVTIRRFASVASIIGFIALGTSAVAFAAPDAAATAEAAGQHHGHHGRHGRGDLLRASLRLDSLSAAQRQQIEGLVQQEKAAHANVTTARSQLLEAVAGRVAAGNVDDVALAPSVQAVEGAIQADEPGDRAALEKLHGILTPAQRVELVNKLESHEHGRREGEAHEHGRGDAGPQAGGEGRGGRGMWGRALNLTDAQKQQIEVNLKSIGPAPDKANWKEAREAHKRVLEAFKGDRFVMNEVAPPRDPRQIEQGVERVVRLAKASTPVLTPEQRATAAAKLREMAARSEK